ncbi:MAG: SH3 domain-containing protein [Peptostreptococcaceae bacterium]
MIKKAMMIGVLVSSMMFTLSTTEIFANSTGKVTTNLNVRSGPSTKNKVIGSLSRNKDVTILETSNGWHKVRLSNNKEGWASGKYINTGQSSTSNNSNTNSSSSNNQNSIIGTPINETGTATLNLNVRSGPSTSYKVVGSLSKNKSITLLESSNGWYKVKLSNNKEGWASGKYIKRGSSDNTTNFESNSVSTNQGKNMKVVATAYTGYSTTSTGQKPVWGTIAVDPRVIPYGTKVYIPQFDQVFVANNTGGAIKGNKIDIYMNTKSECYNWGRKTIDIVVLG